MLIIYDNLAIGGIQTFFLRLVKERARLGKKTKIILLSDQKNIHDKELVAEVGKYAEISWFSDVFRKIPYLSWRFFLLHPVKSSEIKKILSDVNVIHVGSGAHIMLAERFLRILGKKIPVTVGVYHSKEFLWKFKGSVPYFELVHRDYFYKKIPSENIFCFSETTKSYISKNSSGNLNGAKTFRLGVVESVPFCKKVIFPEPVVAQTILKICAVGRLVKFKSYNLWMLDVIKELLNKGIMVSFDIYGSGPLEADIKKKISDLELTGHVQLKGDLNYFSFNDVVSQYDIFVGSGTAIVQAAWLGVPSIIGIESEDKPVSYGFFSDYYKYEYHVKGLGFEVQAVDKILFDFLDLAERDKEALAEKHLHAAMDFNMSECEVGFSDKYKLPDFCLKRKNLFKYYFSMIVFYVKYKITKGDIYSS